MMDSPRGAPSAQAQQNREDMRMRNNEIVVDLRSVVSRLPDSIQGFFGMGGDEDAARFAHGRFLSEYGLSEAEGPPLLWLNLDGGGDAPFSLMR